MKKIFLVGLFAVLTFILTLFIEIEFKNESLAFPYSYGQPMNKPVSNMRPNMPPPNMRPNTPPPNMRPNTPPPNMRPNTPPPNMRPNMPPRGHNRFDKNKEKIEVSPMLTPNTKSILTPNTTSILTPYTTKTYILDKVTGEQKEPPKKMHPSHDRFYGHSSGIVDEGYNENGNYYYTVQYRNPRYNRYYKH